MANKKNKKKNKISISTSRRRSVKKRFMKKLKLNNPDEENTDASNAEHIDEYVKQVDDFPLTVEVQMENHEDQPISGRRIVDLNYFLSQLQEKSNHIGLFDCKAGNFEIIGERRNGLFSKLKLKCNLCQNIVEIDTENPKNPDTVNVNVAAATGIIATGIGHSQFEELFSALDMPAFTSGSYAKLQDIVYDNWEKTAAESMKAAANREKEAAITEGRVKDDMALIDVYVDGAWCSRSYGNNYRANSGAAAIIGAKYKQVLYMAVKNKYCLLCARADEKGMEPKKHTCYKNYSGSSSAMEADIICDGFKASKEMYNIIYARMIADGDSSTYAKVLKANPYNNHTVEKIECRNHILRNFCNKLRAVAKDTKYPLAHRKTLNNVKIMSMRKMIVKSIKHHNKSHAPKSIAISLLHNDIVNSIEHGYGNHRLCSDYNCIKEKGITDNTINSVQNSTFLFRLNAIIATTANKARSLIEDMDTNTVECFNSVIAKFIGGKRVNFSSRRGYQARCAAAVISFNNETSLSAVQKSILGKSPKGKVLEIERRKSLKRKHNQEHPTRKLRRFNEVFQHNYGPACSAPDMSSEQLDQAKKDFLVRLKNLTEDKETIQKNTILQRHSSEWIDLRKKLVTASNFGAICKRQKYRSTAPLVKKILYTSNLAHVKSVAHGIENENQAIQQMALQENLTIEPCGLFIDKKYCYIGATPDGLVGEDCLVEVKCPLTSFKTGINTAIEANKIQLFKYDKKSNTRSINKNSNWFYQVQGQLHVTGRKECIFGIWSGDNQPLLIERIYKDDKFWKINMEEKIVNFYLKALLPEIIDSRHTRGMSIRDIVLQDQSEPNTPEHGQNVSSHQLASENVDAENTPLEAEFNQQHEEYSSDSSITIQSRQFQCRNLNFNEF
ncbi:unnamed protein product [Euphydryas editha]|uniref:YqaJ viral recombinase domain-containing protein n=1 Tax=Euphydryas editha TaxID=104508 RepID=A0AAU9U3C0_EUPED|nr:unnamed protein product [Euphydryas editha]